MSLGWRFNLETERAQGSEAEAFTDAGEFTRMAAGRARNASVRATYLLLKDVRAAHSAVVPQLRA
jgi:hypothetical protein